MIEAHYASALPLAEGKKKIIVCCDGTGNEFGDDNSNVVRLYTALEVNNQQVAYYRPGVGTMGDPAIQNKLSRWFSKVRGLAFGAGFKENVLDAYRYLMETYNDGDQIYLFGFSRGSYTARALAGLLDGYGLLCKGNEGHIPYAWRLYLEQLKNRSRHALDLGKSDAAAFKETFSHPNLGIHFVGLWDTVSAVGWISEPLRLFNIAQNPTIQHIRHAVSIDERRCFYQDNLYGEAVGPQTIHQVWFPGVHSDVGGSYAQTESGLSNEALRWMLYEAKQHGVVIVPEREAMLFGTVLASRPATSNLYKPAPSSVVHHSLHGIWWLLELLPHRYYDKDDNEEQMRVPLGAWRKIPAGAWVHGSAYDRLRDACADYHPKNIRDCDLALLEEESEGKPFQIYKYGPQGNLKDNGLVRILLLLLSWTVLVVLGVATLTLLCLAITHPVLLWRCLTGHLPHWFFAARAHLQQWHPLRRLCACR